MKSTIVRICTGILIGFAFANIAIATQSIPIEKTVLKIHTYGSNAVVKFTPATTSTEGCGGGAIADDTVMIDWSQNKDLKLLYVAVLAAQASGKLLGFGVSGCTPWGGGIPLVYRIDVQG